MHPLWTIPIVAIIVGGAVCFNEGKGPIELIASESCSDAYQAKALDNVRWVMGAPNSVCRGAECSDENIKHFLDKASALREWAKTLSDVCERSAYTEWAWFVEYQAKEAKTRGEELRDEKQITLSQPPESLQ